MFGFVVLVVAVIWTLSAGRSPGPVLVWGAGLAIAAGFLAALGILPLLGAPAAAGFGAAVGSVIGFTRTFRHPQPKKPRSSFDATHAHDNLAINTHRAQLWARDERGKEVVLEAREVREWTHLFVPDRGYKANNRIQLTTTRIDMPVITIPFNRHSANIWGAPKNAQECEEWHARLGAFLQR